MTGATTEFGTSIALGNWSKTIFWGIRWIFFPLGGFMSYKFIDWLGLNNFRESIILVIPMILILITAFLQKRFIDIKILDKYEISHDKNAAT